MRRCPECGYRAKQDLRDCPLCGVRMRTDPDGQTVKLQTHVHEAQGETCLLPNQESKESAAPRYRPKSDHEGRQRTRSGNRRNENAKYVVPVVVLVIYMLLRACSA